jgi:hypothetical protein
MSEPLREQAILALVDRFAGMTGLRPGGWLYPSGPNVSRLEPQSPLPPEESNAAAYPMVRVVPGRHAELEPVGLGAQSRVYRDAFAVDTHLITAPANGDLAQTWALRLREDCLETLHADLSLGGLADDITFGGRADRREDVEYIAPKAWLVLPFTVWLRSPYATTTN